METREHPSVSVFHISLHTPAVVLFLLILSSAIITAPHAAQAQTFNLLHSFTSGGNVGFYPFSGLVMDRAGRLYGTTLMGGEHGQGTVYRLSRAGSGWVATGLYGFQGGADGANPVANVVFGPDGTLYGTTIAGGEGYGTVFNLRPPASVCKAVLCPWTETVLYRFTGGSDGGFGFGSSFADALIFDQAGNIYGTAPLGGAHHNGVVFKLTRSGGSWTESVLWSFTGKSDGGSPESGLIFDSAGNLYGTAQVGGTDNLGVVYELLPSGSGWTQQTLYSFSMEDGGGFPLGGVTMDAQGNLYGTTGGGFGQGGEAYELTLSGGNWTISKRQVFTDQSGPFDTPTLDAHGNLYGTIGSAGRFGAGEVFKLMPSGNGWTYIDVYEFTGATNNGDAPIGGVILDSSGNLYGTTSSGGQGQEGIVWEITP